MKNFTVSQEPGRTDEKRWAVFCHEDACFDSTDLTLAEATELAEELNEKETATSMSKQTKTVSIVSNLKDMIRLEFKDSEGNVLHTLYAETLLGEDSQGIDITATSYLQISPQSGNRIRLTIAADQFVKNTL